MQKIKDTISIWWRDSSTAVRIAGIWVAIALSALILFFLSIGVLLDLILFAMAFAAAVGTVVGALYVAEGLTKANRKRQKAERIRAAYSYKGPEFRRSDSLDN